MPFLETLQERKLVVSATAFVLVCVVTAVLLFRSSGGNGPGYGVPLSRDFYTDDAGASYFADEGGRDVPFDHGGKQAVWAAVYRCGAGGAPAVQYMMRYTADSLHELEQLRKGRPPGWATDLDRLQREGAVFAKPKTDKWLPLGMATAAKILDPQPCADGRVPTPVTP